jgi:hypothetical protein
MKTGFLVLTLMFSGVLATHSNSAHASGYYSSIAAGCKVDPTSAPYVITIGSVSFSGNATGSIVLWCSIPHMLTPSPTTLEILGVDTAPGLNGYVGASILKTNANDGSVGNSGGLTSTDNADGLSHFWTAPFTGGYDPYNWRYVVRVELVRSSSAQQVKFSAVAIY